MIEPTENSQEEYDLLQAITLSDTYTIHHIITQDMRLLGITESDAAIRLLCWFGDMLLAGRPVPDPRRGQGF